MALLKNRLRETSPQQYYTADFMTGPLMKSCGAHKKIGAQLQVWILHRMQRGLLSALCMFIRKLMILGYKLE